MGNTDIELSIVSIMLVQVLTSIVINAEPIQAFVDNYIKLMNDYDINTFRMLLEMKGITKRSD